MGRYYFNKKTTAEECDSLDVFWLNKFDYFCGFKSGGIKWSDAWNNERSVGFSVSTFSDEQPYIHFKYTVTKRDSGEKVPYDYKYQLTTTPCNYGQSRYWFICGLYVNNIYCGRRVGTLYLSPHSPYFGCRHCHELSYDSRNETRTGRFGYFREYFKAVHLYEKLIDTIKIPIRAGLPTKKYKKLLEVKNKMEHLSEHAHKIEDILFKK